MDILEFEAFFQQLIPSEDGSVIPHSITPEIPLVYPQSIQPPYPNWSPDVTTPPSSVATPSTPVFLVGEDEKHGVKRFSDKSEDQEKVKTRKVNQNLACRNYRRRKKEHVQELEAKIAQQEEELEQLRKEVAFLKRGDAFEAIDPTLVGLLEEMRQIVEQLDEAVKNNADEKSLTHFIKLYLQSVEKRHAMSQRETDKLVNPLTQAKLATLGYTPSLGNPIVSCLSGPSGDEWWVQYASEAGLTADQAQQVSDVRKRHWQLDGQLIEQRMAIDRNIKSFYLQNLRLVPNLQDLTSRFVRGNANSKLEMSDIVHFAQQLSALKKNWAAQRSLMVDVHVQFTRILTPRQHALFLTRLAGCRAFDWPRHVHTLRSAWQLFGDSS